MLVQKNAGPGPEVINGATRLFSGLADLDYKPGYNNHTYFQYLSNNKNDISLLGAYHPEEIFDKYIIRVAGKGFIVVNHPFEIYGIPDAHECINGNLPLRLVLDIDTRQKPDPINSGLTFLDTNKISRKDLLSRILIACADILNSDLNHFVPLNAFTLASFVEKVANRVGKPYSKFINLGLYKSRFSLQLLGSAKGDRVKRPAISSVKEEYHELEDYLVQSNLRLATLGRVLSTFKPGHWKHAPFVISVMKKINYKELEFGEATKFSAKPKQGIVKRIGDAISNPRPLIELSEIAINVEKLRNAPEAYPDFLNTEKTTTLIRSPLGTWKTTALREIIMALKDKVRDISSLPCYIWISYRKSLSNKSKSKLDELKASGFRICNYQNVQGDLSINDGTNIRESENTIHDVLRFVRHVLAMDAFANISTLTFFQIYRGENIHVVDNKYQPRIGETVEFIYDLNSGAEAMRIGYDLLRQGKRVAFVSTRVVMARVLVEKASKLSKSDNSLVKAHAYYGNMDRKQRQKDFFNIDVTWVIAITNIATPVHVEALAQMLYRIRDSPRRIVSMFYQKNSNELFRPPGCENIRAELETIKGHREWNNNAISYKIDESLAIIIFIEVEHQKCLSAKYFIEKLCSLIASTGASLQLIKMDESREVIGNCKRICNEVRVEALVIKETDFNAVATSRNLDPKEAEILKFDQERSIADTMALKRFYIRNLYSGKDVNIDDWNNLCNKKFVECFSPPEPRKHFLHLFQFWKHGYSKESAMEGLKAKDIAQWKDTYYKAKENVEKSAAEDLHKLYSANHWKAIRELFQILGFTGIDDLHTLLEKLDLLSAIKTINAIAGNWCGYTVKSNQKKIGPKEKQVWEYSYRINHRPYKGLGFGDKGALELPPYKPKTDNDIQELFDSIGQDK
ncbi:34408_t:CDS:2 [Gigaspora margarita]|uniref:34408_t:CDS:1 n=1 Tax=Gigaspora margarita TaxID=4874 RepID=A0ABN7VV08_GIGMA|nr:34408_t:CDS:2 [Gigaspora margarita]